MLTYFHHSYYLDFILFNNDRTYIRLGIDMRYLLDNHFCDNTLRNMKHIFVMNSSRVTSVSKDNLNGSDK